MERSRIAREIARSADSDAGRSSSSVTIPAPPCLTGSNSRSSLLRTCRKYVLADTPPLPPQSARWSHPRNRHARTDRMPHVECLLAPATAVSPVVTSATSSRLGRDPAILDNASLTYCDSHCQYPILCQIAADPGTSLTGHSMPRQASKMKRWGGPNRDVSPTICRCGGASRRGHRSVFRWSTLAHDPARPFRRPSPWPRRRRHLSKSNSASRSDQVGKIIEQEDYYEDTARIGDFDRRLREIEAGRACGTVVE